MLTMFILLTLENFPIYMEAGMDVHPWSWIYFVSFVMVAAFIVLNVLIGIVLNSMDIAILRSALIEQELKLPARAESDPGSR